MGGQGSLMHVRREGWPLAVCLNRQAAAAKIAEEVNAGSDRKVQNIQCTGCFGSKMGTNTMLDRWSV